MIEAPWVGNPPEQEDLYECDYCGKELHRGDEAFEDRWQYEYYCSVECYLKQKEFEKVVIGD